jgi:hypothetical protein
MVDGIENKGESMPQKHGLRGPARDASESAGFAERSKLCADHWKASGEGKSSYPAYIA